MKHSFWVANYLRPIDKELNFGYNEKKRVKVGLGSHNADNVFSPFELGSERDP